MKKLNLFTLLIFLGTNFLTPLSYAQVENLEDMLKVSREMSLQVDSQDGVSGDVDLEDSDSESFADVQNGESDVQDSNGVDQEGVENLESFISQNDIRSTKFQVLESESELLDKPENLEILVEAGMNGITKNPDANITYTDTNGKVFTGIGTITITSGDQSITILDRNLGATVAGTGEESYGYHFQWGNNYGFSRVEDGSAAFAGDEVAVDGATDGFADTSANAWNNPYVSSTFITDNGWNNEAGWSNPYNQDLWGGKNDLSNGWGDTSADYKRQGPCPAGYHVPSQKEIDDLLVMYYSLNKNGTMNGGDYEHSVTTNTTFSKNFRNAFNVPFAGRRSYDTAEIGYMGSWGYFWVSSAYADGFPESRHSYVSIDRVANIQYAGRGVGLSLRCFLDNPLANPSDGPLILEYETDGGSAIQSQTIPVGEKAYLPGYTTHKDGYTLIGWFNEDGTVQYALSGNQFEDLTLTQAMADSDGVVKVYAKWLEVNHNSDANITYTLNEDEVFTGVGTISISDGETTITILDRNLGATTAGTGCDYKTNGNAYCTYDDTYGYHFQRGNNYGFKPGCDLSGSTYSCTDSITSSAVQGQVDANTIEYDPSNQQYYTSGVFYKGNSNWLNDNSKVDLWGGGMTDSTDTTYSLSDDTWKVNLDTVTSRQGPCPEGFHVPSRGELDKLKNLMGNSASDIHTKLLIPFAGYRHYYDASVYRMGYDAGLWSSSPYSTSDPYSRLLYLYVDGGLNMGGYYRANALSVRCFYDKYEEYVVPATYTLTFDPQGGSEVDTGIAAENTSRTKPENPSKSGYTFVDWYTSTGYETVFDFTGTLATGNLTVYAKWHDNRCEENEEWYEEIGACATRDTDNIVYYWTGSDGKGLISIVSGDIILTMQDKNLGASVAGTGENSYGELYQRGNNAPITMAPTSTGRVEYENYWPGHSFYDANFRWGKNLYDYWKYNRHYDNLWGGSGDNTAGDWGGINNGDTRQGPCDTGYHVPSIMEWDTVLQIFASSVGQNLNGGSLHNFGNSTNAGKFKNAFLLSFAGYRYYYDESLKDQGYDGYYWSSSPYGASYSDRSLLLNLNSFNVGATSFYERARGYSIRCFKDSPDAPKTLILTFDANGGVLSGADSEGKLLQKVETGKLAQVPQGISKTGATFQRWSVEGSEDTAFNFFNPITENKILKAIYSCDTGYQEVAGECVEVYTITYHLDGGENNGNNPATYTVESGNILLAQPNKTGYMFLGWTGSNGDEPNTSVKIPAGSTGNRTYNAVWGIFEDLDIYFVSDTGNVVQYTFMDRNLGATTNDIDDEDSYGYYYKWGNNEGFLGYMDDWDDVPTGTWTEGEQGPCPNGYHIPQKDEFVGLGFGWTEAMGVATPASEIDVLFQDNDLFDLIKQDFMVSLAGGKASAGGILYGPELYVGWHSSEEYDSGNDYILWFSQQTSEHFFKVGRTNKNSGYPVRCFKDNNEKAIQSVQLDGGTGVIIAVKGGHITRLSEPRKSDYDFDGWYSDSGFSTQVSVGDVPPSILYAKWKPTEYTITYQLNDGAISGENINPEKYTIESGNITLINPVKTGYVFLGWSGTDIDGMTGTVMIPSGSTGDRVYEANWHTDQYTITFDTDKGTSIVPIVLDFGSPIQAPANPYRNGYRFIGWDPEIPATMPAENLTIKAIWEKLGSSGLGPRGSDKSDTSKEDNTHSSAESPNDIDSQSSIDKDLQGGDNSQKYSPDFQEYIDAYEFAYEKGITTKPTVEAAIMSGNLTRIAMAKMLSQYAINVLGRSPDKTRVNKFNDVSEELDSKYNNGVTLAYQLGIMGQNMRGNNFRPNDEVTRAEFATALSRMLYSTSDGEYKGTNEYYTNHIKLLKEKGIMTKGTPRMKEKRGYVMIMLMRSAK